MIPATQVRQVMPQAIFALGAPPAAALPAAAYPGPPCDALLHGFQHTLDRPWTVTHESQKARAFVGPPLIPPRKVPK